MANEGKVEGEIFFFYGQDKIVVDQEIPTGKQLKDVIKAHVPSFDPTHDLVLEGHGHDADRVIGDGDTVDLGRGHGEGGPKHFFSRPPTNFG
ncbi:multiubiquitin domain-containing protein [Bradyrhizobium sp. BR 1432]|uniref:multiubiquitin domain-containing protein n=1 Tax=Bradyrhizobium sp. BR 1432 TaxID=3447966 RepID=UPI003EE8004A